MVVIMRPVLNILNMLRGVKHVSLMTFIAKNSCFCSGVVCPPHGRASLEGGGYRAPLAWQPVDWEFWAGGMAACFSSLEMKTETKGPLLSTSKAKAKQVIRQTFVSLVVMSIGVTRRMIAKTEPNGVEASVRGIRGEQRVWEQFLCDNASDHGGILSRTGGHCFGLP